MVLTAHSLQFDKTGKTGIDKEPVEYALFVFGMTRIKEFDEEKLSEKALLWNF